MPLIEEFEKSGNWLFRWRSYLPLLLIFLFALALPRFSYPLGSQSFFNGWSIFCLFVSFTGLAVRILTIGFTPRNTSGRNTSAQVADLLNTTGMYSFVRNPLYLGNFIIGFGISLLLAVWWVPVIYTLLFALYYERIIFAEEMFLRDKFGQTYLDWATGTPAMIPKFNGWRSPGVQFSFLNIIKREYHGLYAIIVTMVVVLISAAIAAGDGFHLSGQWKRIFWIGTAIYIIVRIIHKKTEWLNVEGR